MSFASVWNTVWPIVVAVLVFCVIITIHEFGHFIMAKLFKVKVNEFAVGFGPALFKKKKGDTLYAVRLLPIGGYCAMEGEDSESDDERAFSKARVWKRLLIVLAGGIFNSLLGFIIMVIIVACQPRLATTVIGEFEPNAVSNKCETPLKIDDKIVSVNGRSVYTWDDAVYIIGNDFEGGVSMEVQRGGKRIKLNNVQFPRESYEGRQLILLDFRVYGEDNGFFVCIKQSFLRTVSMVRLVWMSLVDLVSGKFGIGDMSGPVGVTKVVSGAVQSAAADGVSGMLYLLRLLCMITVNLGIFNLLPIPALDGSRALFLAIEGIRRKPIKHEAIVHAVGMALLLALMAVLVVKDLWQWIA